MKQAEVWKLCTLERVLLVQLDSYEHNEHDEPELAFWWERTSLLADRQSTLDMRMPADHMCMSKSCWEQKNFFPKIKVPTNIELNEYLP